MLRMSGMSAAWRGGELVKLVAVTLLLLSPWSVKDVLEHLSHA